MKNMVDTIDADSVFIKILREIVQRIVKAVNPEQIILFGSAARGMVDSSGDIDLLVVKRVKKRRQLAGQIYKTMIGVGRAVDIVVATPEDIERYKDSPDIIIFPALNEGKVIYVS